jgi:hypothetical protein
MNIYKVLKAKHAERIRRLYWHWLGKIDRAQSSHFDMIVGIGIISKLFDSKAGGFGWISDWG